MRRWEESIQAGKEPDGRGGGEADGRCKTSCASESTEPPGSLAAWKDMGAGVHGAARAIGPAGACPGAGEAAVPSVGLWGSCPEL